MTGISRKGLQCLLAVICCSIPVFAQLKLCYLYQQSLPYNLIKHQVIYSPQQHSVYMFGGQIASSSFLSNVYKWNLTATNSWFEFITNTPTTPFYSQFSNNAVLVGDLIYFIGMSSSANSPYTTPTIHIFDTSDQTWSTQGPIPWTLRDGCLATNSTHIFMVDGADASSTNVRDAEIHIYHIAAESWSSIPLSLPTVGGWRDQMCVVVDDVLYAWGGRNSSNPSVRPDTDVHQLDLRTMQVSKFPIVGAKPIAGAIGVPHGGLAYTVGGRPVTTTNETLAYDFQGRQAVSVFEMQTAVEQAGVAIIDEKIYVFGGQPASAFSTDIVQICDLPTPSPSSEPTQSPSTVPSTSPITTSPTLSPSKGPSKTPSAAPSESPSSSPSESPTSRSPTNSPSEAPFNSSLSPTKSPVSTSSIATTEPTAEPTEDAANLSTTTATAPIGSTGLEEDGAESANTNLEEMLVIIGVVTAAVCVCSVSVVIRFTIRRKKNVERAVSEVAGEVAVNTNLNLADQVNQHQILNVDGELVMEANDDHDVMGYTVEGAGNAEHRLSEGNADEHEESRSSGLYDKEHVEMAGRTTTSNTRTGGDTVFGGTKA